MCACRHMYITGHVCRSENNWGGSLVSIHDVGPRNQTQTIRLAVKYLLFSEQSQWSLVILNRKSVSFRGSVLPLSPHNP